MTEKDKPEQAGIDAAVSATADGRGEGNAAFSLDIDKYLVPCPGDNPAGESLRYEGTYDSIQEARKEEPSELPQGIWERELKKANWHEVKDLCLEVLENRSKDIQIAAWLVESLICLHGHAGFREGLKLLLALAENFWDEAYPVIEESDLAGRISPIVWLNEKVAFKLKFVPITLPKSMDSQPYSFADWESANLLEKLGGKDQNVIAQAESEGRATRAKFLGSVMFTSGHFYIEQARYIEQSLKLLSDLNGLLDEKCAGDAPSLNMLKENLENILSLVNNFLKEKQIEMPESAVHAEGEEGQTDEAAKESGEQLGPLSIKSRSEAYQMLSTADVTD
ncbi:MAG: type VI secretion system protein TssA [Deltaproteobacteria bacterium]|nr:type VI secretion system protein TssA [Deltaproteobacteria bacterium]